MADLFDTNILIDYLKGIPKATQELKASADPAISTITWIEVMAGASTPADISVLRAFLANFKQLPVTDVVAERAASNRRQRRGSKLPDAIILKGDGGDGWADAGDAECEKIFRRGRVG